MKLGELIINEIIYQGMIQVAHPDPDESHVFSWNANAAEQLEAVVDKYIKENLEEYTFEK